MRCPWNLATPRHNGSTLRHNADEPIPVEVYVEGKRCGNLEAAHQGESRAIREGESLRHGDSHKVPVPGSS